MAIKGKGKTKSRPPSRAPRRGPVEVPTPFTQRRWVQLVAVLLLGAGFPFFLGGITKYLDQTGVSERVLGRLLAEAKAVAPA